MTKDLHLKLKESYKSFGELHEDYKILYSNIKNDPMYKIQELSYIRKNSISDALNLFETIKKIRNKFKEIQKKIFILQDTFKAFNKHFETITILVNIKGNIIISHL